MEYWTQDKLSSLHSKQQINWDNDKNLMEKKFYQETKWHELLLEQKMTPISSTITNPVEILFERKLRSLEASYWFCLYSCWIQGSPAFVNN